MELLLLLLGAHFIEDIGVLLVNLFGHFLLLFLELPDSHVGVDTGAHTAEDYWANDEQKDQPDGPEVDLSPTDLVNALDVRLIVQLVTVRVAELHDLFIELPVIIAVSIFIKLDSVIIIKQLLRLLLSAADAAFGLLRHIFM